MRKFLKEARQKTGMTQQQMLERLIWLRLQVN